MVVSDNPAMSRFEMPSGDAIAFIEYRRAGDRIVLIHTEVPEALSGQGVGSKLVAGVLDQIRSEDACRRSSGGIPATRALRSRNDVSTWRALVSTRRRVGTSA